jgi:hypothetical protein
MGEMHPSTHSLFDDACQRRDRETEAWVRMRACQRATQANRPQDVASTLGWPVRLVATAQRWVGLLASHSRWHHPLAPKSR